MDSRWMQVLAVLLVGSLPAPCVAGRVDGFTEPLRSVDVATTEIGIVKELRVHEGDRVDKGTILATLDDEVQTALLSIAHKNLQLRGRRRSAEAELQLRRQRLTKLESLSRSGHARQEEVERARADLAIAEAQLLAAEEELAIRQLEYNKAAIQVQRRKITAPLSGVVAIVMKEPGEFVAPTDPYLLKLVQLDQLMATFSVQSTVAEQFEVGQPSRIAVGGQVIQGRLERMAPITDAESDTVRIKIRIDNTEGAFRSGERCSLLLPD